MGSHSGFGFCDLGSTSQRLVLLQVAKHHSYLLASSLLRRMGGREKKKHGGGRETNMKTKWNSWFEIKTIYYEREKEVRKKE